MKVSGWTSGGRHQPRRQTAEGGKLMMMINSMKEKVSMPIDVDAFPAERIDLLEASGVLLVASLPVGGGAGCAGG